MFADSQRVQLEVLKLRKAGQSQAVCTALQRAAVNHEDLGGIPDRGKNGLDPTAHAGETTHSGNAEFLQTTSGAVRQFAGVGTAGARQRARQPLARRILRRTLRWMLREILHTGGVSMSAATSRRARGDLGEGLELGDLHSKLVRSLDQVLPGERARPLRRELVIK